MDTTQDEAHLLEGVAIVGMAGKFPGARSVEEFWRNQLAGVEAISRFTVEELEIPGAAEAAAHPNYVPARSVLDDVDLFDAEFFGIYPREAELMDPQHRLFLECCWQAFEDAGYDPAIYPGPIGVFAGASMETYFLSRLCTNPGFIHKFTGGYQVSNYAELVGNSRDFLATRVSYKLNLRGPSFTMQSGCSTSLMCVTQACQSLLTYQSDMALAGGSSITFPQKRGAYYLDGGMASPDGHCRTFDADAAGTVFGGGVAVVLLKRVEDAVRDGDQIYAVIRGFAVNNDGAAKVGYMAPSVEGQSRVIALAHEAADVDPETIGYVEAHGTGTPLGDPIEVAALTRAFRARTDKKQFCTIGTAKTNVGHLDVAAGVTGLIHATHIVRHGTFPSTLHYHRPNTEFDLESTPFRVNTSPSAWKTDHGPRRAGVSAFGVGGTNAHVVLEQAPEPLGLASTRSPQLLVLSARSAAALDRASRDLAMHLGNHPDIELANAAWTLQVGRRAFEFRRTVVARDTQEAIAALSQPGPVGVQTRSKPDKTVAFLFPGQGSQYPNMGRDIYAAAAVYRETVDRCCDILTPHVGVDIRTLLFPSDDKLEDAKRRLTDTMIAQPAIFTVEYALAKLWMSWGVRPSAMLGHSIGEFAAACLAGVFSLEDALALVAARGRMMQELPAGGMLSVRLSEAEVRKRLNATLSVAAVNSPSVTIVSGPFDALADLEQELGSAGIVSRRLVTSHAFHSAMMDPIVEPFAREVAKLRLNAPQSPYVSSVTGTWITAAEATDPNFWARHMRQPVLFSAAIGELRKDADATLLEVGPGRALNALARQHTGFAADQVIVSSLSEGMSGEDDSASLMKALGSLWIAGIRPDWRAVHGQKRRRISLPTYPFERKRYWLEPAKADVVMLQLPAAPAGELTSSKDQAVTQESLPMNAISPPSPAQSAASAPSRINRIRTALAETFEELSGVDLSTADSATTFLEMGFDSLFLTQVTQALQSKFDVKITFRQLLGDQSTFGALAEFMDSKLPADTFAEPVAMPPVVAAPPAAPVAPLTPQAPPPPAEVFSASSSFASAPAPQSAFERVMRDQLQAMNEVFARQLEALRGVAPALVPSMTAAMPVVSAPPKTAVADTPAPAAEPAKAAAPTKETPKAHGPFKPVQKGTSADLTDKQERELKALIERHTRRTAKSKSLTQRYRKPLADPRVVSGFRAQWKELVYPIVTDRSKGSRIWDIDGNEYVDIVNGFGPIMLGHRPDFVEKAIEAQLHAGFETGPQTPLAGEVAEMFCAMTGNERMSFCNTGSEAVLAALRVARTVTGRNKVVFFSGDYHGMFDEVLVKGFKNRAGVPQSAPIAPGIPRENVTNMVVLDFGTTESLEWIRQNAKDLAAVMVEPVQSRHPGLQPVDFLKQLRKITEDFGVAFIFDEVVTGFRVHPGGCQALFGIRADLATYGKVVAGGMPIGILAGKSQFMDALDGGAWQFGDDSFPEVGVTFFAGTFVRHPLAVAAAKAVLQHLAEQGPALQEKLTERTTRLVRTLNDILAERNVGTTIESFGSIFYLGFPGEERFASLFYYYMRDKGIHVREGFPCFLTTAHSDADIELIVRAFRESLVEMQDAGLLAPPTGSIAASASTPAADVPLTEPQREIFLAAKLGDDASCSFNESFSVHLRGELRVEPLRDAVNMLIARHEALRSNVDDESMTLRFRPELKLEVPLRDLSKLDPAAREMELQRMLADDAHTAFDLTTGPLVRVQLVCMEAGHHILVFTSHHIVCDGWSTNVLLDDLSHIYSRKVEGLAPDLPPAVQFSKYAQAQASRQSSAENTATEAFWLAQYRELPPPLELPVDRPRPTVRSYAGTTFRTRVGVDAYRTIKQLGAKKGCTLFATLLAGFQALLHRLANQSDIVVGIPAAGQSLLDDGALVGHCVNFLPLRVQFREDLSFAELLAKSKTTLLDAYEHQSYTYGTLVRKLAVRRDPSRLPLMEVQFNLERIGSGADFHGLQADTEPNPKGAVNFDLFFNVIESDQGLTIDCDYNSDLFDEASIARWLVHYEHLLLGAASAPDQLVDDLPLMTTAQTSELVAVKWNPRSVVSQPQSTIDKSFERQAARTPDAIAVTSGDERLTYRELNERANRLARFMRARGVASGSLVAVSMERSPEMIVAFLAILKAGAGYLPIDSSYPLERLAMIFADARPQALLTQERLVANLPKVEAAVICVDRDWPAISREDAGNLDGTATPDAVAYVIYTSGSTGKPKGVMVSHHNVVRLMAATDAWFRFGASDVWTLFHSYAFDFSVWEMWGCLLTGGRLVIVPYLVTRSPQEFYDLLAAERVTVLNQTPAAFYQLIHVEEAGYAKPLALRTVIFGGEALNLAKLAPWFARHGDATPQLVNMYGITETTVHVTYRPLTAADANGETRSLIGTPIPDLRLYLLDHKQRPVPPGVVGEIFVGGAGVAGGYLNRDELTAERFLPDPFAGQSGARMYRSGDLARLLNNGDLEYLGRRDSQVKIHGFRIELGEIEAALAQHQDVRQAAVMARQDGPGEPKLVAYVVAKAGARSATPEFLEFLRGKLPAHMIPFAYVAMDALPLTVNGKVDWKRLPAPDVGAAALTREYVAPRTPQEKILADILAEVLRIERVGVTDNLFELGADSLHVFQITSRAVKAGLAITPRMVLQQRTIAGVLSAAAQAPTPARPAATAISRVARQKYRVDAAG